MLSVSSVKGDAGYYTSEDNYYASGALEDRWMGEGAAQLGLEGKVDNVTMDAILHGRLPDGSDLSRMVNGKNTHRSGYDLTFSAPKSVSIMALVAGDKRFIDIHNRAVAAAMSEVEQLVSTRITEKGVTDTVLTGNMVAALFNHDTSRDLDPQLHTHALVFNATFADDKWRSLASDTRLKTGFGETLYATQIALGKIYQNSARREVEGLGFETVTTGKNGLWEIKDVPTAPFSRRSQAIADAAGPDASRASRDVAALDTRQAKAWADPELLIKDWQRRLTDNGYDIGAAREAAEAKGRGGETPRPPGVPSSTPLPGLTPPVAPLIPVAPGGKVSVDPAKIAEVTVAIGEAISALSDKKVQFTWSELLAGTVNRLPAEQGVFALARAGLDKAIDGQRLIPLDREKGIFTSDIHLLNELSVQQVARETLQSGQVLVFPEYTAARHSPAGDAVSVLSQDRHPLAVLSGKGGAEVQRERILDVAQMARAQGREVVVISSDARSQRWLAEEASLKDTLMSRHGLKPDSTLPVQSTLIVEQAEKLTLKETLLVLEKARDAGAQVLLMDSENRQGTGNALSVLKNAGVPQYHSYSTRTPDVQLVSEPDKRTRYAQLAADYVRLSGEGREVVVQASGPREQAALTADVRTALQAAGELGSNQARVAVLEPVWLDSKTRRQRDSYREGMVMERWDGDSKLMHRYTIDRVADHNNSLVLKTEDGLQQVQRVSQLDNNWSLFRSRTLEVAAGEKLRVLGREAQGALKSGTEVTVASMAGDQLVVRQGEQQLTLETGRALKLGYGYVESAGKTPGDARTVLAAIPVAGINQHTLQQLARSGNDIRVYTPLDEDRAARRLGVTPQTLAVSEQVIQTTGQPALGQAMNVRRDSLMSDAELAVTLAIPRTQAGEIGVSRVNLLADAQDSGVPLDAIRAEINRQVDTGTLIDAGWVPGAGNAVLVPRQAWEMEKSIIRHIAEGKEAVTPLMPVPPATALSTLTPGQREATRLILQSQDRFTAIQGYAGVGKTTQFRAVMAALNVLSPDARPEVIGLGPTHRAVHEMQDAGVKAQTLSSFLSETRIMMQGGEVPDFSNVVFLADESSMTGNRDAAELYRVVSAGGGRMVSSGDTAQLQAISSGSPFRLVQQRSAIDTVVMQEIVRQTPELRPAIESMIAGNVGESLTRMEAVTPDQVPRRPGAWVPASSVEEITLPKEERVGKEGVQPALRAPGAPENITDAVVADWLGRTVEAQRETLIIAHRNDDRREINSLIHQGRHDAGEVGKEERTLSVLIPERVPDNALRSASTFAAYTGSVAMVNSQYYRVESVSKDHMVTLRDTEGNVTLISPQGNSTQDITVFREGSITVSEGDRVRFSRSDNDRGYVANSLWEVSGFTDDGGVRFRHGEQEKILHPGAEQADRHIDLAYAVTAYGAQGASARYEISLEGTGPGRLRMASLESAYVTLSRAKEHAQVYTDNRDKWTRAAAVSHEKQSAHDILLHAEDRQGELAGKILAWSSPLSQSALGRRVLSENGLEGDSFARFVAPVKKYPAPHVALPVWSTNGRDAGVLLTEIRLDENDRRLAVVTADDSRLLGGEQAQFAGLQRSRNGDTLVASSVEQGMALAQHHPDSGVVIQLSGDESDRLLNMRRLTGGSLRTTDITDDTLQTAARASVPEDITRELSDTDRLQDVKRDVPVTEHVLQEAADTGVHWPSALPEDPDAERAAHSLTPEETELYRDIALAHDYSLETSVMEIAHERAPESLSVEQMQREEREFVVDMPEQEITLEEKTHGE
ncbi:conjugative transfer relaxase/helicase TraI [Scandinavium goeteborgense]|uniref:Conjugative transfer relaxase protein TraI n=1 Tax=Scandinavium goeteborgense TaxID=1851514 RepID=A0A4R6E189_SCAGO|nr:conjugative transfer relaxase/helicase TraI [Scandinavium goeteborgense]TDN51480.1 conjugative transfer relaxase protein TraI [Scandinavium goeteborgense]